MNFFEIIRASNSLNQRQSKTLDEQKEETANFLAFCRKIGASLKLAPDKEISVIVSKITIAV